MLPHDVKRASSGLANPRRTAEAKTSTCRAPCFLPPGVTRRWRRHRGREEGRGGEGGVARDPGGLGNQLVKFNYRVRGGGSCLETCEGGWPKGVVVVDGMEGTEGEESG